MLANWQPELVALLNMLLASVLAGAIGLERELAGKPAGLRTHILVGASVSLLMSLGLAVVQATGDQHAGVATDPTRIIHAVIVGVSFLGAGTIIGHRDRLEVSGLTTAGSILLVTVIGLAVGFGRYILAVGATLLALIVLWGLGKLEDRIGNSGDGP